jgi:Tol biopolymer transport system component
MSRSRDWIRSLVTVGVACLLLGSGSSARQSPDEFPRLIGPYLGQKPPGTTPEIFAPGIVSKDGQQEKLNFSPDQREAIFWERAADGKSMSIIRMTRTGDLWGPPEPILFSTEFTNMEPTLSPDGLKLFFVSDRPLDKKAVANKTPDLWYVEKVDGAWSEPINLGSPVNGDSVEVQPLMSADNHFYFCRPPGEIYCSMIVDAKMQTPVKLSEAINKGRVSSPCLPPDCTYMIFHSYRAGGHGGYDLYVSFKDGLGDWAEAENMDSINTPGDEGGPTISPDGKYLFFSRDGNIYWVSTKIIEELSPKHQGE